MNYSDRDIVRNYLMRGQQHFMTMKKSDGRIEIPRFLIGGTRWEEERWAFFYQAPDAILIYPSNISGPELLGKISISFGRIRVPSNILNKMGFYGESFTVTQEEGHFSVRPYNRDRGEELNMFVDTMGPLQLRMLSNFILGRPVDMDTDQMIPPKLRAAPIFLTYRSNMVFRAIGMPYQFNGLYIPETKEIVVYSEEGNYSAFRCIPGIKRHGGKNTVGYLIVNDTTYGSILAALQNHMQEKRGDVELVFIYNPMFDDKYRAFVNPPSDVFNNELDIARELCADITGFMNRNFRCVGGDLCRPPCDPPILTDDNVDIFTNA